MVTIAKFTNKSGKEISYLEISNEKYPVRIGFKKAKAVIENLDAVKEILSSQNGSQ